MIRNDYMELMKKYFERCCYINLFWFEKIIIYIKYGVIKAILSSIRNEVYKNLIYNKYREKEELFNKINQMVKEWLNKDLEKEKILELIENIIKNFEKKNNDLNVFVKIIKKNLNKEIIKEIFNLLNKEYQMKKEWDYEIKDVFDNNIMLNKLFWLSTRNFATTNQNKRFLNREGFLIMNYLQNMVDMIGFDYKKYKKLGEIKEYIERGRVNKLNIMS